MKKYIWLRHDPNKNQTDDQVLENNETLTKKSLIIRDETINRFMIFDSISEYSTIYHQQKLHWTHEIILRWQLQKPKFDIDDGTDDDHTFIIEMIECAFHETYGMIPKLAIIESINTNPSETKLSKHIIATNVAFADSTEAKHFTRNILKPMLLYGKDEFVDNVDKSIQNLRLPLTTNGKGRILVIPTGFTFDELVVTNCEGLPILPKITTYIQQDIIIPSNINECAAEYIKIVDPLVFMYRKTENNLITFKRLQPAYCDLCDRQHESVGMYLCVHKDGVTKHCYRSKKCIRLNRIAPPPLAKFVKLLDVVRHYVGAGDMIDEIKNALLQIVHIRMTGQSSIVLLQTSSSEYELQSLSGFMNSMTRVKITKDISIANIIDRNQLDFYRSYIVFNPKTTPEDSINLFTGFKATIKDKFDVDVIKLLLDHIHIVWCCSDDIVYNYVLDWLANIIRGNKNGTVLVVFSEKQGAGKNIITDFLRDRVIGQQYASECNDIDTLTSKFNAKFANKMLTMINEANSIDGGPGTYHKTFDKMKDLITNSRITVERKGVDSCEIDDFNNFIITTNNNRPVKLEVKDRRYSFLRINEQYCGNTEYFTQLAKSLENAADDFITMLSQREIISELCLPVSTEWRTELLGLQQYNDPIDQFITETTYSEAQQTVAKIYTDYCSYCSTNGVKPMNSISLMKCLVTKKFISTDVNVHNKRIDGKFNRITYRTITDGHIHLEFVEDEYIQI